MAGLTWGWPASWLVQRGAICRVFCLRMVDKTGKGGPQLLLLGRRSGRRCDGTQGYP